MAFCVSFFFLLTIERQMRDTFAIVQSMTISFCLRPFIQIVSLCYCCCRVVVSVLFRFFCFILMIVYTFFIYKKKTNSSFFLFCGFSSFVESFLCRSSFLCLYDFHRVSRAVFPLFHSYSFVFFFSFYSLFTFHFRVSSLLSV